MPSALRSCSELNLTSRAPTCSCRAESSAGTAAPPGFSPSSPRVFGGASPLGFYNPTCRRVTRRVEDTKGKRCFKVGSWTAPADAIHGCAARPPTRRGSGPGGYCHLGERAGVLTLPQSPAPLAREHRAGQGWSCPPPSACAAIHRLRGTRSRVISAFFFPKARMSGCPNPLRPAQAWEPFW